MTVNDLYALSASFLSESTTSIGLTDYVLGWTNLLLAESLPYENSIRGWAADATKPVLLVAPTLTALTDIIPYSDTIVRVALPYGLASYFFQDDDNDYRTSMYRNQYINALNDAKKAIVADIEDVYGGDE